MINQPKKYTSKINKSFYGLIEYEIDWLVVVVLEVRVNCVGGLGGGLGEPSHTYYWRVKYRTFYLFIYFFLVEKTVLKILPLFSVYDVV